MKILSWLLVILVFLLASIKSTSNKNKYQSVAVVIPAFNEEDTVAKIVGVIKNVSCVNEVIVVDDGSEDNTAEEARIAGANVISHEYNRGKGAAIKTGFDNTKTDIVAFIDADIYNLTSKKVEAIILPILEGKTDITKTKFARESGRVTELTAKPLLKFFFPEVNYEQPLSGQFAGKRSVLKKINFESDYGVDVGIVLDADVKGLNIQEVDIGGIKHDMSPLEDLNLMANEVVRTIISRAMEYGRVTMIDSMGNFIRMAILGASLIILGLFVIFFVPFVPYQLGLLLGIIGLIMAIFYIVKLVLKSVGIFKKSPNKIVIWSFLKMHMPLIIIGILLLLMISTFISATTITDDGKISIEATSRNLVIFPSSPGDTVSVRGPFTVDSAIENESTIIRMPYSALQTLQLSYGDSIIIGGSPYVLEETRDGETNILRLPSQARSILHVQPGDTISNSRLSQVFDGIPAYHNIHPYIDTNDTITESFFITQEERNSSLFDIYVDNQLFAYTSGIIHNGSTYIIMANGEEIDQFSLDDLSNENNTHTIDYKNHTIQFINKNQTSSIKLSFESTQGAFLNFNFPEDIAT